MDYHRVAGGEDFSPDTEAFGKHLRRDDLPEGTGGEKVSLLEEDEGIAVADRYVQVMEGGNDEEPELLDFLGPR